MLLHLPHAEPIICSCIYFVPKICLRMCEVLRINAHETFPGTNGNNKTENPGQNSKITFFNWVTLTFDLWPWPMVLNLSKMSSMSIPVPNFVTVHQSSIGSAMRVLTHRHTQTHRQTAPFLEPRPLMQDRYKNTKVLLFLLVCIFRYFAHAWSSIHKRTWNLCIQ